MSELADAIEQLTKGGRKVQVSVGKVKSIDENAMTCEIDMETSPIMHDVRLRSIIDNTDKGILVYPKKGSHVLVGMIDNKKESAFICGYSEVDKVRIICDDIELAGNQFEGLVKAPELKTQLDKMTARIDMLYNAINAGTPGVGAPDSGAALATSMKTVIAVELPKENFSNIKNENVKHG